MPGEMLEVGAGSGAWSRLRARKGWGVSVVEPSEAAAAVLKKEFDYLGAEIETLAVTGRFDEVSEAHVVEHVSDPERHLKALAGQLKPGGVIRLITPNARAWKCNLLGPLWLWVLTEHLQMASARGLCALAERAGLEVISCHCSTPPPSGYPGLILGGVSWFKNRLKGPINRLIADWRRSPKEPAVYDDAGFQSQQQGIRSGRFSGLFVLLARLSAWEAILFSRFDRMMCRHMAGDELILIARKRP